MAVSGLTLADAERLAGIEGLEEAGAEAIVRKGLAADLWPRKLVVPHSPRGRSRCGSAAALVCRLQTWRLSWPLDEIVDVLAVVG